MVRRLEEAVAEPFVLRGGSVRVGGTVGVVLSDATSTVAGLLAGADMDMYRTKMARRGGQAHPPPVPTTLEQRRHLADDLAAGLRRGEVVAYLQPIVEIATGRVAAVEALARWCHPDLGVLLPDVFIDLAEDANLDVEMGEQILASACVVMAQAETILPGVGLCVNLSVGQLGDPELGRTVLRHLAAAGLTPDRLTVEITERATLGERSTAHGPAPETALHDLRRLGIQLSLDDFGTGHSSLTHLRRYPLTAIKIDRSFVSGMLTTPRTWRWSPPSSTWLRRSGSRPWPRASSWRPSCRRSWRWGVTTSRVI